MTQEKPSIGVQLVSQHGDMAPYRRAWIKAEEYGADHVYVTDHFHAQNLTKESFTQTLSSAPVFGGKNFEATSVQAAIAATTSRIQVGCVVHANSYRNPNLMADIARTIDHISNGRFVLGMGAGYLEVDYKEYGYELGTAKSRMQNLARDVPIIKARFEKLNPPPLRKIPLLIAAMGEGIGMRIAAEHADIWHLYGELDKLTEKIDAMRKICDEIGRDFNTLTIATNWNPTLVNTGDPDSYLALGISQISTTAFGPDWDLGGTRELLEWRKNLK